ncbi:MAG TPA: hypothetical protein VHP11_08390 [Tepidisphaeraceae bacterium]|nr:hypothetical protein [Tepidisphaeraceae bacterium]
MFYRRRCCKTKKVSRWDRAEIVVARSFGQRLVLSQRHPEREHPAQLRIDRRLAAIVQRLHVPEVDIQARYDTIALVCTLGVQGEDAALGVADDLAGGAGWRFCLNLW